MLRALLALVGGGLGYLLVIPIIVVGMPFWIVAVLTRTLKPWISPRVVQWTELIQFDPMVGWKPRPGIEPSVRLCRRMCFMWKPTKKAGGDRHLWMTASSLSSAIHMHSAMPSISRSFMSRGPDSA